MASQGPTVEQHFSNKQPQVRSTYERLLELATQFGSVREEPKKTSIHLMNRTAFAGVATRKESLILTLRAATDLTHARIIKHEQTSANRWHLDFRLESPEQIDSKIESWLRDAFALAA
jgi:Domain of unknown function (DUF5655)